MAYPTLRQNEIFSALYNQIISIDTFADNIAGTNSELVDKAKTDAGKYGDTKVYISTDALKSAPWGADSEATNLLAVHRPPQPETQTLTVDKFRQICLTVDDLMSKRAFATEGGFSQFNSAILGWMSDTRKVIDSTTYNVYIGNAVSQANKAVVNVPSTTARGSASTEEEANRLEAVTIAQGLADLLVDMTDVSRDFNDYKFLRSYAKEDIKFIFNAKYLNKLLKIDLPTIFNKDGLVDKLGDYVLPARYFGRAIAASDKGSGKIIGSDGTYDNTKGNIRVLEEMDVVLTGDANPTHFFAGDLIPNGATVGSSKDFEEDEVYIEDDTIICKVVTKLPPYLSSFQIGNSFYNPKALLTNHYLTFSRSTLAYLKNYPFLTVKAV